MRRITLLRHAQAVAGSTSGADRERPLDERGLHDAPQMGRRLRDSGARPSLILTSPATRAWQTARLLATEIGYPLEFLQRETDLYLASPEAISGVLARQDPAFTDLLVCAHNPGLTDFANRLVGGGVTALPPCGLAVIEADIRNWAELRSGRLLLLDGPH